ncbi:hypothetical protein OROHE_014349 [Orobanche hederae]
MVKSSSSPERFFQGDRQFRLMSSFRSSSNSLPHPNVSQVWGDVSNTFLNSVSTSGLSIEASSLVTDANSGLSGGPHLQRCPSFNTESYMRLPASPISFSSNNISMDGSSVVQQSSNHGDSTGPTAIAQLRKKPRLDIKQEDIVQPQFLQQVLQRQDHMHLQNSYHQWQALIQQQRLRQQEVLQAMTPIQRVQFLQQNQPRQPYQLQGMEPASAGKPPHIGGVCSRRLMQYLYHQRQRPSDNTITYWRKFVAEYYSPRAKKRWCLSQYDNVGHHPYGVFSQSATGAWRCDICGSKSGRGFEATFKVLPRLNETKFGSGVIDELLYLDLPREYRFPSGIMMLEYAKAVQESVYEQLRVVREGQLRILFTPDLKILSWEFCARRHEELVPRRLIAPQVNQLLLAAHKCQSTICESGPDGISLPELKSTSVMVVAAGRQLARSLELQSINDLGFSKKYVRCLQVADVVNSMEDLMDFCREYKKGPLEGLKNFPRRALNPRLSQLNDNNHHLSSRGSMSGSAQPSIVLTNYQNFLTRQNSMNSTNSPIQNEPSSSNQAQSSVTRRVLPGILENGLPQQHYLQDMRRRNGLVFSSENQDDNDSGPAVGFTNGPWAGQSEQSSRSNSFKAASSESESPAPPGELSRKASDLTKSSYLTEEMVPDIGVEFTDDGFFDDDFEGSMDFGLKA